jgi:hypothetical protein
VVLHAFAFTLHDRRAAHAFSRWLVRAAGGSYELRPGLDVVRRDALASLALPPGLLAGERT